MMILSNPLIPQLEKEIKDFSQFQWYDKRGKAHGHNAFTFGRGVSDMFLKIIKNTKKNMMSLLRKMGIV